MAYFSNGEEGRQYQARYCFTWTVKPVDLMKWLIRLVTPPEGVVLDPFLGSGTTVYAARELGFRAIGIEQDEDYVADAIYRLRQGVLL